MQHCGYYRIAFGHSYLQTFQPTLLNHLKKWNTSWFQSLDPVWFIDGKWFPPEMDTLFWRRRQLSAEWSVKSQLQVFQSNKGQMLSAFFQKVVFCNRKSPNEDKVTLLNIVLDFWPDVAVTRFLQRPSYHPHSPIRPELTSLPRNVPRSYTAQPPALYNKSQRQPGCATFLDLVCGKTH